MVNISLTVQLNTICQQYIHLSMLQKLYCEYHTTCIAVTWMRQTLQLRKKKHYEIYIVANTLVDFISHETNFVFLVSN